ncbi:MAG: OmpA family protein [Phycisphaerae bacterium]
MALKTLGGLLMALTAAGMSVGCCEKEKQMLADVQAQYNELSEQNRDLRMRLSDCESRRSQLQSRLDEKDMQLAARSQEMRQLQQQLASQPEPTGQQDWERGLTGDRVTLASDILFASGSATLTSSGKQTLDRIAADLKNQYAGKPVRVYGYTDSDPIRQTREKWDDNLDLSANRAMAVTRYLIEKGLDEERIETIAMGATNFVASNASTQGKAKNRRVEIVVIR